MTGGAGHHHRSGPLKQQNKTHKQGKHRSKGQLDNEFKGTVLSTRRGLRMMR
jgi:pre-rRNA-processing protein TSR1